MKRRLRILLAAMAVVGTCTLWAASPDESGWHKVLGFDAMATERSHKADLGNHRRIEAGWESDLGWEIEVLKYGDKTGENPLYDGNNWHGVQPWMVYAWTKHQQIYPDVRTVPYDKRKSKIRIVLIDCQTQQTGSNSFEFVKGKIEVFHKP
jgi:hypothetical protein